MQYCRSLEFSQQPDYEKLDGEFNSLLKKIDNESIGIEIDWSMLKKVFIKEQFNVEEKN